ncbi:MAG: PAS domain S-box protein [Gemmatimonadota bacterium]
MVELGKPIPFPGGAPGAADPASAGLPASATSRIARICALGLGMEELLGEVCREMLSLCGGEACYLAARGPAAGEPEVWRSAVPGPWPDLGAAFRSGPSWEALLDRLNADGTLAVADAGDLPPDHPVLSFFGPRQVSSLLLVPLRFGTRLLGVLSLHAFTASRRWGREEVRLAEGVAPVLAAALERRRIEARLRDSEARYRFLAENALDLISLHDTSGKYLYASPAAKRMLGYRPEEMTGCPAGAYLPPADLERIGEGDRRLVSGEAGAVTLEHRLRRRDGTFAEVETVSSAVPDDRGRVRQIVRVTRDITDRKRMETRLVDGQKGETIGMLAGGVAHEFNNLLAGINGAVEMLGLLLSGNAETERFLELIGRLGNRAAVLTRQLLAYAGQGKYSPEIIALNKVVSEDVPVLKSALPGSVELRLDLAAESPLAHADIAQLKQVVTSLCLNAGEAMPGGGTLTIRTRREAAGSGSRDAAEALRVAARSVRAGRPVTGDRAVLEVSDTGCGMEPGTMERIFEPFFSTKFVGRGMGLAAVRGIVENHEGEVLVRSEPGKGTTVSVAFPAASGMPKEPEPREAPPVCGTGLVLVADDEDDVRAVVRAMLESFGYGVLEARDGREAVERFRERRDEIDLVLLDLMMPRMTGEEAFAEIRRIAPDARAILASGYDESGRLREIVAAGFETFLQKPFRRRELGQKVGEAIAKIPHRESPKR